MPMRTIILMLTLFILMPNCVYSQGKITTDPNSSIAGPSVNSGVKSDARLAQKITYSASRRAVVDILEDMTNMTGVKFHAGYNSKDWQVRDRKMNIYAKDTALTDLMSSISRVMKFKWLLSGEGEKTTYRLYMDRKALLDAETQALREEEHLQRELAAKREKMIGDYGKLASLSPEEIANLKNENPFMYFAASSGLASPLVSLFEQVPSAIESIASSQSMTLNAGDLPEAAQQSILQSMQTFGDVANKLSGKSDCVTLPDVIIENLNNITIQINGGLENMQSSPLRSMMLGDISIQLGKASTSNPNSIGFGLGNYGAYFPLLDPNSKLANLFGSIFAECYEEGKTVDDVMKGRDDDIMTAVMADIQKDDSGEPLNKHPDDSALEAKIKAPKKSVLAEIEAGLAEASGFAVVSDSFENDSGLAKFGDEEITIKDALEKIADSFRYNWDKRASVLELRDRNWFRKRSAQIPQAWIDAWKKTLKDTGTLDIGGLAQIATLTQEQFNINIEPDDDLMRCGITGVIYPNRDLLRTYAQLNEAQRAAVFAGSGLDLSILSPDQWSQFEKLFYHRMPEYLKDTDAVLTLSGTRNPKDNLFDYTFTITTTDDLQPIEWTFTTPKYQEPPKEQPKEEQKPETAK
ncbi:MAG: hypothetical protein ABFD49_06425 [Armatimonadota bacterium]|nr:hypothetical protein [bacterium]